MDKNNKHNELTESIKVKGIGVAPAELKDLLLGHPKVEDVAAIKRARRLYRRETESLRCAEE